MGGPPSRPNQLALASLISGAVSVMSSICCCIPIVGMIAYLVVPLAGLVAIVTGALALQEANKTGLGKNEAIAGIALGSVGVLIGLSGVAMLVLYGGMMAFGAAGH